jgi:crotonobetainyl-CoA:carnitine CoA-transferase CaiB-like acyl-CoA transferase
MTETPGVLDGIRILDLTSGSFGYTGRLLAGYGAEVVKVEPPEGDILRSWPPFANDEPHPERGVRHLHLSAGKRGITIDLEREQGRALLLRLVAEADVLVESFAPGYLAGLGLSYDDLLKVRPDLVMASVTHFGQDGPYADYEGAEIVSVALGGYLKLTGDPDREPVKPYDDLVVGQAALHATMAVITGIFHRDLTGEGDLFDVAAIDAALFLLGGPAQTYHFDHKVTHRNSTRLLNPNPFFPYPSTLRPCKDGYIHAHGNYGHPDLLAVLMEDPSLDDLMDQAMGNATEIDEKMDVWLANYDKFEVVRRAQELRIPFTEVLTPVEALNDPHLKERGFFVDVEHPEAGTVRQPGAAAFMTETPWKSRRAPLLGEHTDEVLGDWLGLDADQITALREQGAV